MHLSLTRDDPDLWLRLEYRCCGDDAFASNREEFLFPLQSKYLHVISSLLARALPATDVPPAFLRAAAAAAASLMKTRL